MDNKEKNMDEFLKAFRRAQNNAVYFLEFWNCAFPKKKIELTDEEKQRLFDEHMRAVPLVRNLDEYDRYQKRIDDLRKKGYKDWQIF